jgi:hypothetical protein
MIHVLMVHDLMPTSERTVTPEGYLVAPARLSRVGVQRYRARELRGADGMPIFPAKQPDDIVTLMRPPEEVFDPESIASFEDMPITNGHPDPVAYPNGVTADTWKLLAIGHVRDCKALTKDGYVGGRVRINDSKAVSDVFSGRTQLSVGYGFDCEIRPGVHSDGQAYDGVMRKVRGNHLATTDVARGGPGCRIADHQPTEEDQTMATVKIAVDSVEYEVPEGTAATLIKKLSGDRETALTQAKEKEAAHATAVTRMATDHAKELADLRGSTIGLDKVDALVTERVKLLGDCGALCPEIKVEGLSTTAIRRAMVEDLSKRSTAVKSVVDAVLAGVAIDKAGDDQITVVTNAAIASVRTSTQDAEARRNQIARAFAAPGGDAQKKTPVAVNAADAESEIEDLSDEAHRRKTMGQKPTGK